MTTTASVAQLLTVPVMKSFVNGHAWVWPVSEMVHYVGMSLIMGLIGVLDLRILGLFRQLPIGALRPFVGLALLGFIANVLSGLVFLTGSPQGPEFYVDNLSFQLKMAVLLLAGLNLVIFQVTGLEKAVYATPSNGTAPSAARVVAVVSLASWVLVIFFGRLLMYNDTLLLFLGL
jgi:uncharacterized membrane protein